MRTSLAVKKKPTPSRCTTLDSVGRTSLASRLRITPQLSHRRCRRCCCWRWRLAWRHMPVTTASDAVGRGRRQNVIGENKLSPSFLTLYKR